MNHNYPTMHAFCNMHTQFTISQNNKPRCIAECGYSVSWIEEFDFFSSVRLQSVIVFLQVVKV